ncbi:hypothetical protein LTR84_007947 [Exophiala bonariae]|uniref:DUF924-domain-containing protein n=1 Tax=Exophiala bonariae TaxID=1690606 RepID=A0AAV9NLW2_9EURO|nr:hypothetical protein LTR84_007947 [Exophiala bonariae]
MLGVPQALSRVRPNRVFSSFKLFSKLNIRQPKVLQLQSAFSIPEVLNPWARFSSNMTSSTSGITSSFAASSSLRPPIDDPEITSILSFWFSNRETSKKWFGGGESFDQEIRAQFASLVTQARNDQLDHWTETPQGSLALILLLDQFPRNIHRDSDQAHASDAKACQVAVASIAREFDKQIHATPADSDAEAEGMGMIQALFFYLPLMHDESVMSQIACIALSEALVTRCELANDDFARDYVTRSISHAKGHRDTIVKFGRFPKRNAILGRESTEEERLFLEQNPGGFFYSGPH